MKTAAGEKITVTTRIDALGTERVVLCVAGKSGRYIVDVATFLSEEECELLAGSLAAAATYLKKVSDD